MENKEIDKQEMIGLLKKNGIVPDRRCTKEDLEALIDLEINNK